MDFLELVTRRRNHLTKKAPVHIIPVEENHCGDGFYNGYAKGTKNKTQKN